MHGRGELAAPVRSTAKEPAMPRSRPNAPVDTATGVSEPPAGTARRSFLGYLIAAPTLVVAAQLGAETVAPQQSADAAIPSLPQPAELFDLGDLLTMAALATSNLIAVQINTDGTASFALPRAEVGQGITTLTTAAHRRGTRPAARQGARHPGRRPARAAVQPAHRRLEHHPLDLHAGAHGRGRRPGPADGDRRGAVGRSGRDGDDEARVSCTRRAARARATARWPARPRRPSRARCRCS